MKIELQMSISRLTLAWTALAAASIVTTAPAHAQDEPNGAAQADSGLADIVVTATRRSESLQAVPLAVTAVTPDRLEAQNITNLSNLSRVAPSLQVFAAQSPGTASYQIRGQFQSDTAPTLDPSVGIYFDDVYIARAAGTLGNLLDMERVEVLKGPQGTLFGRNTTGGAVRLISRKPTSDFGGYVSGTYERFDQYRIDAVVNAPIAENLAIRLAGRYFDRGGFYTNTFTGNKVDHERTYFVRGALSYDPTERLNILIQGDYTRSNYGGTANYLQFYELRDGPSVALEAAAELGLNPRTPEGAAAGLAALRAVSVPGRPNLRGTPLSGSRFAQAGIINFSPATGVTTTGGSDDPFARLRVKGVAGTVSYDLGLGTLRSITSYRRSTYDQAYDVDGLRFAIVTNQFSAKQKQFSQEFILNGSAGDDLLDWTVGANYFWEHSLQPEIRASLPFLAVPAGVGLQRTIGETEVKASGAFAQLTYHVTPELSAIGGLRYTIDKRAFETQGYNLGVNTNVITCAYNMTNRLSLAPGFALPCNISQSKTFKKLNYTASLDYELGSSRKIYVRTSRGFRAGGFNFRVTNSPLSLGSFNPEVVTDYEIGLKADWINRTLRTNIALFTSKTTDLQQSASAFDPAVNSTYTKTVNAGTRRVKGVEIELAARPAPFLNFDFTINHTDGNSNNPNALDITWLGFTPKWAFNLGGDVSARLGDEFRMKFRGDLSHRSKMLSDTVLRDSTAPTNPATGLRPIAYVPFVTDRVLASARLAVNHERTGIEVAVFGTNLFNNHFNDRITAIGGLGLAVGVQGQPRTLGMEIKVPFGEN